MNIVLRELSKADLTEINKWRNDHDVVDLLGNNFLFIAKEVDELWYENYLQNRVQNIRLAIEDKDNALTIGTVQLTNIQPVNRVAEYSIMIGDKRYWNKGVGAIATEQILAHGFNDINLNRIYLTVLSENARAIRLYKKMGFIEEGVLEEAIYKNGRFQNMLFMALLKKNYFKSFII